MKICININVMTIGEEKFGCYRSGVGVDSVLCTKSYRRCHWRSSEVQSMNAEMDF